MSGGDIFEPGYVWSSQSLSFSGSHVLQNHTAPRVSENKSTLQFNKLKHYFQHYNCPFFWLLEINPNEKTPNVSYGESFQELKRFRCKNDFLIKNGSRWKRCAFLLPHTFAPAIDYISPFSTWTVCSSSKSPFNVISCVLSALTSQWEIQI